MSDTGAPAVPPRQGENTAPLHLLILKCTQNCNLRCQICGYSAGRTSPMLTSGDFSRVIAGAGDTFPSYVLLTGGEPLVAPDIAGLARLLAGTGANVAMCSNGVLLAHHAAWILDCIDELFISVWGVCAVTQDALRGKGVHRALLRNLATVTAHSGGPRVVLHWTVMPENLCELTEFPDLASNLAADGVSVQPADVRRDSFGPGSSAAAWSSCPMSYDGILSVFNQFYVRAHALSILRQTKESVDRVRDYVLAAMGFADFPPVRCNAPWRSVVVQPNLMISPCYFLPPVGNLREDSLPALRMSTLARWLETFNPSSHPRCRTCVCPRVYPGRMTDDAGLSYA